MAWYGILRHGYGLFREVEIENLPLPKSSSIGYKNTRKSEIFHTVFLTNQLYEH